MYNKLHGYKIEQVDEKVKGLTYVSDFITKEQEIELCKWILKSQWNTSLKRRTQHYGYQYRYDRKNQVSQAQKLPEWALPIKKRIQQFIYQNLVLPDDDLRQQSQHQSSSLQQKPIFQNQTTQNHPQIPQFDQLIINQYQPGQGINPHIDNINIFLNFVVSLSLSSECIMEFDHQNYEDPVQIKLKRRSIIVLDKEARYQWKHSIPPRKKDNGKLRGTRYSMTFRIMKKKQEKEK